LRFERFLLLPVAYLETALLQQRLVELSRAEQEPVVVEAVPRTVS
jgi:hypothetical protein